MLVGSEGEDEAEEVVEVGVVERVGDAFGLDDE